GSTGPAPTPGLLRAGLEECSGHRPEAVRALEEALELFERAGMRLYAAAARRRLGQLLGGDRGRELVAAADAWMAGQGVVNPARRPGRRGFSRPGPSLDRQRRSKWGHPTLPPSPVWRRGPSRPPGAAERMPGERPTDGAHAGNLTSSAALERRLDELTRPLRR